ncbi:MAG TPA: GGDEF domain-containing protein [Terracidiphilus sp.]|jgi:diguanylate cyclase (GGDEF)-like protein
MISLKRYFDAELISGEEAQETSSERCMPLLAAYRSALAQMGECGAETCPSHGAELKRELAKTDASMGNQPNALEITSAERSVSEILQKWGKKTALHYEHRASEVKDLLLVMARTAESLGHKDEQYAQQLDSVTAKLETIAGLDDVTRIRSSVEESAHDLRISVSRMVAESKTVIHHLRAEVSAYEAKLQKAEHIASCDTLTGLGSRFWIEGRIQQRIDSSLPFSILLIDVDRFRHLNDEHGKFVGDQLLKEFARELRSTCRFSDLVGRWGGDRFIVLLDCTGSEAQVQAARLQKGVSKAYHVPGTRGYVNLRMDASVAIAECREGDCLNHLLERVDVELMKQRTLAREELTA